MAQLEWHIKRASPTDWPSIYQMTPELLAGVTHPQTIFIATFANTPQNIIGVAFVLTAIKDGQFPGFSSYVKVKDGHRKQGLGRALIRCLQHYVAGWSVPYLHSWQPYAAGEIQTFLIRCGFRPYLTLFSYEADRAQALQLTKLLERYLARASQKTPYTFKPIAADAHANESALYSQHFHLPFHVGHQLMQGFLSRPNAAQLSFGLYQEQTLKGMTIGYEDIDGVPKVEFWLTLPNLAHTPAAMLLLCYFAKLFYAMGYAKGKFECNEHARATLNVLNRIHAVETSQRSSFYLPAIA